MKQSRIWIIALVLLCSLALAGAAMAATKSMAPAASLELVAEADALSGDPGEMVTYTLHLTNTDVVSDTDSFTLTVAGNEWDVQLPMTQTTLVSGTGTTLAIQVTIPVDALAGATDVVTVTATSQNDPLVSADVVLTTDANAVYDFGLSPAADGQSAPSGAVVTYTLQLANDGNITDTYEVSFAGNLWDVQVPLTTTVLGAGESTDVVAVVTIPTNTLTDMMDVVTVTVASEMAGEADAVLTTSVQNFTLTPAAAAQDGQPGDVITYTLSLANVGLVTDTFTVTFGGNLWDVQVPLTTTVLVPGESIEINVYVTIPVSATAGSTDAVTVTVTSAIAGEESSVLTTSVPSIESVIYLPVVMKPTPTAP